MSKSIAGYIYFGGKKKRSVYGYNPDISKEEAEAGKRAKHRFLRNVARLIEIAKLERKAGEDKLTDREKLQLIKLDREFERYEIVKALEREEIKVVNELNAGEADTLFGESYVSDPASRPKRAKEYRGKVNLGGKAGEEEKALSATLIKHKKAVGWTEEEYKRKLAEQRGKRAAETFAVRKKAGLKETRGRKKGTKFDARVKRFVSKEEKEELDKK